MVEHIQEVHVASIVKTVQVTTARTHPIPVGDSQLTAAKGRGAEGAEGIALTPTSRLEGLAPMVEDWDSKVTLLTIGYKYYSRNYFCVALQYV